MSASCASLRSEGVLLRHPAVQEAAIVGFAHERWGEAPHAFVVLKEGAHADERELREFEIGRRTFETPGRAGSCDRWIRARTLGRGAARLCCSEGRRARR